MIGTAATYSAHSKRGLILHDSLVFLALLATSVALFGVTLFLFRSFEAHRVDLGRRWGERGRQALAADRPEDAVSDLRIALSYTPDGPAASDDQLLLAQGLAQAGRTEEATNYFLNLWEARPGDGFINLQLARLARQKGEDQAAEHYFRDSIFGSWPGDGVIRRRQVRLELIDFLIGLHLNDQARNELYIVAGNAPNDVALNLTVASKLTAAGYLPDALTFFTRAIQADPRNRFALEQAGRVAYQLTDYAQAERLLRRASDLRPNPGEPAADQQALAALALDAHRIQQLTLNRDQPPAERTAHILEASGIAQTRLHACLAQPGTHPQSDPQQDDPLDELAAQWTATPATGRASRADASVQDTGPQDAQTRLIYQTEQQTAKVCGQPVGDDALLLLLANAAQPPSPLPAPAAPLADPVPATSHFFGSSLFTRKKATDGH